MDKPVQLERVVVCLPPSLFMKNKVRVLECKEGILELDVISLYEGAVVHLWGVIVGVMKTAWGFECVSYSVQCLNS